MVTICPSCHEEINMSVESTIQVDHRDYHIQCVSTTPIFTPRTLHQHRLGWGVVKTHAHPGGLTIHSHKEHEEQTRHDNLGRSEPLNG